ncbi:SH3 domain-containing protein [Granulicella sp. 5B5]|nr:SH3 domain-containing protein [Granulicella sp. 5B5]
MLGVCAVAALSGCNYFRQKTQEHYVYVTARQVFLRDRVAAVSNRTGTATNGEKLVVLDRTRRAIKVRTPRGEVGWVEEKLTADQKTADQFAALAETHGKDPVIAVATARDEVYLHAAPGRETPRFYRLAEGDGLSLLERATVPKVKPGAVPVRVVRQPTQEEVAAAKAERTHEDDPNDEKQPAVVVPPPVMEDWWLARTVKGQTGWILGRMVDVTVPDTLARYAEGQRIVGAYVLHMVDDPDSGMLDNGKTVTEIPEYLTLLAPYKSGLPYDFDQVRVFIWNIKKHRYETGFREHDILGYLPAKIGSMKDPYSPGVLAQMSLPSFTYKVLAASAPIPEPDPATGLVKPSQLITKTYRLEGNICRRILPPGTLAEDEAHPVPLPAKDKNGKSRKRRR